MQATIRRKLSMAQKVLDFSRTNPSEDAGYSGVVTRLEQALGRALTLAQEAIETTQDELIGLRRRAAIRRRTQQQLRHLAAVGHAAAAERTGLGEMLAAPGSNLPNRVFITRARILLERATEHQDLLKAFALGEDFLTELGEAIAEFESIGTSANIDRVIHVGARRDLRIATAECRELIGVLDGFNRARFANDARLLGAWEAARDVFGPIHNKPPPTATWRGRREQGPAAERDSARASA